MLHQVGAGTLGPVFRAHDPVEGRLVAIKAFRLDLIPERATAFAAALNALAGQGLDHPSIASPLAAGVEGTTAWLAQAYVPAESLDSALRQYGPPPLADALAIVTELAGALDFAAAAGVLHGALHPRDVLVAPDDTRLVDLGIAAALEGVGLRAPIRRPYAAPERIAGGPVSRAADIFGLGAIAYELVTGQRVTGAGDDAVAGLPDIPGAHRDALVDTFAFALSPAPDERFTTALGFVAALKKALGDAPARVVVPAPPPPADRARGRAGSTGRGRAAACRRARARHRHGDGTGGRGGARAAAGEAQAPRAAATIGCREGRWAVRVERGATRLRTKVALPALPFPLNRSSSRRRSCPSTRSSSGPRPHPTPTSGTIASRGPSRPRYTPRTPPRHDRACQSLARPARDAGGRGDLRRRRRGPRAWPRLVPVRQSRRARPRHGDRDGLDDDPGAGRRDVARHRWRRPGAVRRPVATGSGATQVAGPSTPAPKPAAAAPAPSTRPDAAPRAARAQPPPAKPAARPPAPVRGQLVIRSTPAGARVEVNGRLRGQTPLTLRDLPLGATAVRVTRDGFGPEQRRVTLTASRASQAIDVPLAKAAPAPKRTSEFIGTVFVETRPVGAKVFLDGREVGTSPVDVPEVPAGSHVVRLELKGFKRWSSSVTVVAGERNRVAASLEEEEVR